MIDAVSLRHGGNALLATLPEATLARMAPHCFRVILNRGDVISEADEPITSVLFIEQGIASIFKPAKLNSTEICLAGPESFCGTPLVLMDSGWPYRTIVQAPQLTGIQIEAEPFRLLIEDNNDLLRVLLLAVQARFVQVAENLFSNTNQRITQRLARWLLMYRDRLQSDRLEVTHEYMALMLGVQRTGVTGALHEMEGDGLIAARRGLVTLLSVPALLTLAAGGYGVAEKHQARLLNIVSSSRTTKMNGHH